MELICKTLQQPTHVRDCCTGSFTKEKEQELISLSGSQLNLYKLVEGQFELLSSHTLDGCLLTVNAIKLPGTRTDLIAITSDLGIFVVYDFVNNKLQKIHEEPYGRSGTRRIVPGIYAAVDPKGRCIMLAALEYKKLTFILNREDAKYLISSPLEINSKKTIVFDICGVDVGFDNPVFAVLECNYDDAERNTDWYNYLAKYLVFYELDLGLNTMVKKHSQLVDSQSHKVVTIPSAIGPSGVFVCTENKLIFVHPNEDTLEFELPRRFDSDMSVIVNAITLFRSKKQYFYILQLSNGDVFKLELLYKQCIFYFLIHLPCCTHISVFKSGFIYFSTINQLYRIESFGSPIDSYYESSPSNALELVQSLLNLSPLLHFQPNESSSNKFDCFLGGTTPSMTTVDCTTNYQLLQQIELPDPPVSLFHFIVDQIDHFAISFISYTICLSYTTSLKQLELDICKYPSLLVCSLNNSICQVTKNGITGINSIPITHACSNSHFLIVNSKQSILVYNNQLELTNSFKFNKFDSLAISSFPLQYLIITIDQECHLLDFKGNLCHLLLCDAPIFSCSFYTQKQIENRTMVSLGLTNGHATIAQLHSNTLLHPYTVYVGETSIRCNSNLLISNQIRMANTHSTISIDNQMDAIYFNNSIISLSYSHISLYSLNPLTCPQSSPLPFQPFISYIYNNSLVLAAKGHLMIDGKESNLLLPHESPLAICTFQNCLVVSISHYFNHIAHTSTKNELIVIKDNTIIQRTVINDFCRAITSFQSFLLAGLSNQLCLYAMGKKQFLIKYSLTLHDSIFKLDVQGNRIYCGTLAKGLSILEYHNNVFVHFCDDYKPRQLQDMAVLDYNTIAVSDIFGVFEILSIPNRLQKDLIEDMYANKIQYERGYLNGAPHRLIKSNSCYTNDILTQFYIRNNQLLASGIHGSLLQFTPISLVSESQLLSKLYHKLSTITDVKRMASYTTLNKVMDAELLLRFMHLKVDKQNQIADELETECLTLKTLLSKYC